MFYRKQNFQANFQNEHERNLQKFKYIQESLPYIYAITPTYKRLTQKADLIRLCQTLMHVENMHWILVEDAKVKSNSIYRFMENCGVLYTHLALRTRKRLRRRKKDPRWKKHRGVEQRNAGLTWLRKNIKRSAASGVVYFADDDNTYDLQIFEQVNVIVCVLYIECTGVIIN